MTNLKRPESEVLDAYEKLRMRAMAESAQLQTNLSIRSPSTNGMILPEMRGSNAHNSNGRELLATKSASDSQSIPRADFSTLPLEIQLMIWKIVCKNQATRLLYLYICRAPDRRPHYRSTTPTPVVLRVCKLSRELALPRYWTPLNRRYDSCPNAPSIYFRYNDSYMVMGDFTLPQMAFYQEEKLHQIREGVRRECGINHLWHGGDREIVQYGVRHYIEQLSGV